MDKTVIAHLQVTLFLVAMALIIAAALGVIVWGFWSLREYECKARWEEFEPRWSWSGGCQIKVDGKYIPETAYAVRRWE